MDIVNQNLNPTMDKSTRSEKADVLEMTSNIVAAYVNNNSLDARQLPVLIKEVYATLTNTAKMIRNNTKIATATTPAVPIEESVTDDYIVCLEDGRKLKMLKRHLRSSYNMTIDEYRERWSLPLDYPVVAPNYAKKRSSLAVNIGLGRRRKKEAAINTA